jgi:hypothetical protein
MENGSMFVAFVYSASIEAAKVLARKQSNKVQAKSKVVNWTIYSHEKDVTYHS